MAKDLGLHPTDIETMDQFVPMLPVGAGLDIATGFWVEGMHGDMILVGGLHPLTGIVGRQNRFKSTILNFMLLSAMNRIFSTTRTKADSIDTEVNYFLPTLQRFMRRFNNLYGYDVFVDGIWEITNKIKMSGNKWFDKMFAWMETKVKNKKNLMVTLPIKDIDGKQMRIILPTFATVDSLTELDTDAVIEMQDDTTIGDAKGNTMHMKIGADKTRFMMMAPRCFTGSSTYLLLSAHLDDSVQIATGPYAPPPEKQLRGMKLGEKIKGVGSKFTFLAQSCWCAATSSPLMTKDKTVMYPRRQSDTPIENDKDLNLVSLVMWRCKSGRSDYTTPLIISQSEGVLPELTNYYIAYRDGEGYGFSGNDQNYVLDLYPDVKLRRTTIREKLDTDPKLCRAMEINCEMYQMTIYHRGYEDLFCTPKELYDDLKAMGYDWDMILGETRGWYTVDDHEHPLKRLSTLDLLRMRKGLYKPYWMQ